MGKIHINSPKNKQSESPVVHLDPPAQLEVAVTPEVIERIVEIIVPSEPIIVEKPIEVIKIVEKIIEKPIIKEVIVEKIIEKPIEIIKEIHIPSEPVIITQPIDRIIEPKDYKLLKQQNKLFKIIIPILAVVAIIGLFI